MRLGFDLQRALRGPLSVDIANERQWPIFHLVMKSQIHSCRGCGVCLCRLPVRVTNVARASDQSRAVRSSLFLSVSMWSTALIYRESQGKDSTLISARRNCTNGTFPLFLAPSDSSHPPIPPYNFPANHVAPTAASFF